MKPECSLPHSQTPDTCSYLEPDQSIPRLPIHLLKIYFNIIFPSNLGLPSGLFPSGFRTKTPYAPLLSPYVLHWPTHLIILDFITRTILGEEYKSLSSSLCLTKNQASWNFVRPDPEVTWRTVSTTIRVVLLSPYLCIRGVSLSSVHYNQSRRVYMLTEDINTFA
jgi:hypothetical protein